MIYKKKNRWVNKCVDLLMTIEFSFDVPFFLQTQASEVSSYRIQCSARRLGGPVAKWLKAQIEKFNIF